MTRAWSKRDHIPSLERDRPSLSFFCGIDSIVVCPRRTQAAVLQPRYVIDSATQSCVDCLMTHFRSPRHCCMRRSHCFLPHMRSSALGAMGTCPGRSSPDATMDCTKVKSRERWTASRPARLRERSVAMLVATVPCRVVGVVVAPSCGIRHGRAQYAMGSPREYYTQVCLDHK